MRFAEWTSCQPCEAMMLREKCNIRMEVSMTNGVHLINKGRLINGVCVIISQRVL